MTDLKSRNGIFKLESTKKCLGNIFQIFPCRKLLGNISQKFPESFHRLPYQKHFQYKNEPQVGSFSYTDSKKPSNLKNNPEHFPFSEMHVLLF